MLSVEELKKWKKFNFIVVDGFQDNELSTLHSIPYKHDTDGTHMGVVNFSVVIDEANNIIKVDNINLQKICELAPHKPSQELRVLKEIFQDLEPSKALPSATTFKFPDSVLTAYNILTLRLYSLSADGKSGYLEVDPATQIEAVEIFLSALSTVGDMHALLYSDMLSHRKADVVSQHKNSYYLFNQSTLWWLAFAGSFAAIKSSEEYSGEATKRRRKAFCSATGSDEDDMPVLENFPKFITSFFKTNTDILHKVFHAWINLEGADALRTHYLNLAADHELKTLLYANDFIVADNSLLLHCPTMKPEIAAVKRYMADLEKIDSKYRPYAKLFDMIKFQIKDFKHIAAGGIIMKREQQETFKSYQMPKDLSNKEEVFALAMTPIRGGKGNMPTVSQLVSSGLTEEEAKRAVKRAEELLASFKEDSNPTALSSSVPTNYINQKQITKR